MREGIGNLRSLRGRNTEAVLQEIAKAKKRFGLPAEAPVRKNACRSPPVGE